jgi:hypothetical protein
MSRLETWLGRAVRHLSKDSAAQVRSEIQEHYESARDAALSSGATSEEADRSAVAALGDARTANAQYRRVLLTTAEARVLREGNWEARTICSRPWLRGLLLAVPVAALTASTARFLSGAIVPARALLAAGVVLGLLLVPPLLPIYTPVRARIYRGIKWVVLVGALGLAFWPDVHKSYWLLLSCLWIAGWIEWTRISIRRKLPVEKWPKQLYL